MVIRRNRFYMYYEAQRQAKESNRKVDPTIIAEINPMPNCSSNIEMSDEETQLYDPWCLLTKIPNIALYYANI